MSASTSVRLQAHCARTRRFCLVLLACAPTLALGAGNAALGAPAHDALGPASLFQMVGGLALVVVSIFILAWLVRRFGRIGLQGGGHFKVIGMLSLGTRERAVLLQVGDEQLLVGVAPGRVQTLHVLNKPVDVTSQAPQDSSFAERLRQAVKRGPEH